MLLIVCNLQEYESQSSSEARLVKQFDLLEMILQAHEYEELEGMPGRLQEFFDSTNGKPPNCSSPFHICLSSSSLNQTKKCWNSQFLYLIQLNYHWVGGILPSLALVLIAIFFVSSQVVFTTQMCCSLSALWTKRGDLAWLMEQRILGTHRRLVEYPHSHTRLHTLPDCNTHKHFLSRGNTEILDWNKDAQSHHTSRHVIEHGKLPNLGVYASNLWGICSYFDPFFLFYLSLSV